MGVFVPGNPGFVLLLLSAVSTIGCSPTPTRQVESRITFDVPPGTRAAPLALQKVVVKLGRGQRWGSVSIGLLCVPSGDLTWQGGRISWSADELNDVFYQELTKAKFDVVGNPNALFEDAASNARAEYVVAGLIKSLEANLCFPNSGMGDSETAKGSAFMRVEWQVYSRLRREVVYSTSTEGSANILNPSRSGAGDAIFNSFALATKNLLADRGFFDLVTRTSERPSASSAAYTPLQIALRPLRNQSVIATMAETRAAVATVFAGDEFGSGFFIDERALLITNYHVVGDAKFVKVRLATGRELLGEVIRKDKVRDVALVQTEPAILSTLAVREAEPAVGEEVFAIGSPLDKELSGTVSKGIVSSYRAIDGVTYLQSDVNVQPGNSGGPLVDANGNVVAIAVSGLVGKGGDLKGINFFIPATQVLQTLGLTVK